MADDRAAPINENYNAEVEAHIFGIIAGDIPYVSAEEDEKEDVSAINSACIMFIGRIGSSN
jgi:hypothetical protein